MNLLGRLLLVLRLGLPIPEECKLLKYDGVGIRGAIDMHFETGEEIGSFDPATALVTAGFWLWGMHWVSVVQAMGLPGDLWKACDELVNRLLQEYITEQERRAKKKAAQPIPGQQLTLNLT